MKHRIILSIAILTLLVGACPALAEKLEAQRITMDFKPGQEPTYKAGSLNFQTGRYHAQPLVFRTVWQLDSKPAKAVFLIDADNWCFVWINGKCVVERSKGATFPLELDLAEHLKKGKNVVAVSVGKEGFALTGVADVNGGPATLTTNPADWKVWKFAPLTILEKEPFLTKVSLGGIDSADCKAVQGDPLVLTDGKARQIWLDAELARMKKLRQDLRYRAKMMLHRGVVFDGDTPRLWLGPERLPEISLELAGTVLAELDKLTLSSVQDRAMLSSMEMLAHLQAVYDNAVTSILRADRQKLVDLLSGSILDRARPRGSVTVAQLEKAFGHPLNDLNSSVANKAGWIDDPTLIGSVPQEWGVRVNPLDISWKMDLAGKWRFKLDPNNTGLAERVHEFGYNIANQWPQLTVPGYWEKQGARFQANNPKANAQSPFKGVNVRTDGPYNGFAWYRKKILVPKQWAGYDLELYMGTVDDWDWAYWNGKQVGHTGAKTNPKDWWSVARKYTIPKEQVTFGGYNVIAVRVYDCGAGGGIMGGMELRCPALEKNMSVPVEGKKTAKTKVVSSPLSPAALLEIASGKLELFGWDLRSSSGPDGISLDIKGKGRQYTAFPAGPKEGSKTFVIYDSRSDGPLAANWLLLWAQPGRTDGELPIQLILLNEPRQIAIERTAMGTRKVTVDYGDEVNPQALIMRPIRRTDWKQGPQSQETIDRCVFWSRAALAWPMQYAELAKPNPAASDELLVEDVYDYRTFTDAWGTEAIQLAPLPPLACYGLSVKARSLRCDAPNTGLSLGQFGSLLAARGNSIRYTVPLDTLPRLGGFTSFCFGGTDVGAPGNIKEIEIMAYTGANSYRPQSNDSGRAIMRTVDWANQADMNLMFNIDNGLGAKPAAINHWVTIGQKCKLLPPWAVAYDLINEPANMPPKPYNAQIKKIVAALRKVDKTHPVYIETPHSFASIDQFINLDPVDDDKVVYTFHDYDYRLKPRWPTMETDIRNMQHQWIPAFLYSLKHDAPICISEYGGFEQTPHDPWTNPATLHLLADFFAVFDQFGFHHHYYANRGIVQVRPDGSIRLSLVHEAFKRLFEGDTFYRFRDNWHERIQTRSEKE